MCLKIIQYLFEVLVRVLWRRVRPPLDISLTPIHKLPPELILLINGYLSPQSSVCLSLTCSIFYFGIGKQCIESLKLADRLATNAFLRLLERDLPTRILCPHCNKLHDISKAENYYPLHGYNQTKNPELACRTADSIHGNVNKGIYPGFSSTIFRMAMKAHRQGHETTNLLRLLGPEMKPKLNYGFTEYRRTLARIQGNSLLMRAQLVVLVSELQKLPLPWTGGIDICPHIQFMNMFDLHMRGIQVPHADNINEYKNRQGILSCGHCYTEFRFDFKNYPGIGNAMFVTRWMDVGEGRESNDHKLRSRLGLPLDKSWSNVVFRRGSICAAFEQEAASAFKFGSHLRDQSKKALFAKNPWPWPEDRDVSFEGVTQQYKVRRGKFIPIYK